MMIIALQFKASNGSLINEQLVMFSVVTDHVAPMAHITNYWTVVFSMLRGHREKNK